MNAALIVEKDKKASDNTKLLKVFGIVAGVIIILKIFKIW